jgi:hypothetical protein
MWYIVGGKLSDKNVEQQINIKFCVKIALAHDALIVREFLDKNCSTRMDHQPYSPDLAPCDFWVFPKLKNALKGQRFADISIGT